MLGALLVDMQTLLIKHHAMSDLKPGGLGSRPLLLSEGPYLGRTETGEVGVGGDPGSHPSG